ncbi:MAG: S41 family peptidase [Paramuribaculum sp.]|nr:S41 family peptidase [Paramuribaculum sp.]
MIKKILPALILLTSFTGAFAQKMDLPPARKLAFVQQIIEQYYVDTVNGGKIADEAIVAMLKTLDPHSTYSDPEATRALTEPLQGNFSGIGIQFNMLDDTIRVIQTVTGGPSEKVGILAGDRILSANDTLISGVKMPQADVMKRLRGPKGSKVAIKVARKGVSEPIDFLITRDDIPTYSVSATYMASDSVGYIKVTLFGETTPAEVSSAIAKLKKQGMKHLILDLEDNGGGYLQAATEIAGIFLEPDELIVYTEGTHTPSTRYTNSTSPQKGIGRLVITVNQYSASASEIVSGAMQDQDRGLVVGRRTFGKGLVQRPFPFPDGSLIRLTTARYFTPAGRCIQKPYTAGDEDDYNAEILHRYLAGEFMSADSIHFDESLLRHTLKHKRPVYGGGGIMPDLFVPVDTSFYSTYYRDVLAKGILHRFCNNYIDENRKMLKKEYPTEKKFAEHFTVTQPMMQGLIDLAQKEGIAPDSAMIATSEPALRVYVKALIGRDLFEQSTYYLIANKLNPIYNEALRLISDPAEYRKRISPDAR